MQDLAARTKSIKFTGCLGLNVSYIVNFLLHKLSGTLAILQEQIVLWFEEIISVYSNQMSF